jgi:predicted Zn-dependent protease
MYSRNRSDITTISSSSDEEPVEEYGTSTKFVIPQHRSSFSAVEPRMKHYYDSTEMHSKSSPRLRVSHQIVRLIKMTIRYLFRP